MSIKLVFQTYIYSKVIYYLYAIEANIRDSMRNPTRTDEKNSISKMVELMKTFLCILQYLYQGIEYKDIR